MKKTKRILALGFSFLMLLSLCACGSKSPKTESYYGSSDYAPAAAMNTYSESAVAAGNFGGFAAADMEVAEEAYYKDESAGAVPTPSPAEGSDAPDENPDKIIYSADATVETTEFDAAIEALNGMVKKYNAWLESSSVNGSNYSSIQKGKATNRSGEYVIRVPADRFNDMMGSLSNLGNVPYSHVYTSNVTSQYYDTQARLKTYKAQEERLLELLDMAKTVSDVIEVENELTDVRYRIESLQTSLNSWDRQVSYSTVYLSVREVSEYTPEASPSYGSRLARAFSDGLDDLGDFFIELIEALPVLILLAILLVGLIHIIKRAIKGKDWVKKSKEKRQAKKAAKQAAKDAKKETEAPENKE